MLKFRRMANFYSKSFLRYPLESPPSLHSPSLPSPVSLSISGHLFPMFFMQRSSGDPLWSGACSSALISTESHAPVVVAAPPPPLLFNAFFRPVVPFLAALLLFRPASASSLIALGPPLGGYFSTNVSHLSDTGRSYRFYLRVVFPVSAQLGPI